MSIISTQHLMRAIRIFIKEGEGTKGKASAAQGTVREEDFAKQLRLARYLAGTSLGSPRAMEKADERTRSVTKPKPRTKTHPHDKKGSEA